MNLMNGPQGLPLQEEKRAQIPSPLVGQNPPKSGQMFTGASHLWAQGQVPTATPGCLLPARHAGN